MTHDTRHGLPPTGEGSYDSRPRYVKVREELGRRIAQGEYRVGTNLPTESELCESFAASRHTVREALRGLVERGLIERRQGAGSIVVSLAVARPFVHSVKSLLELWSYARTTKIIAQSAAVTTLNADEAVTVGIAPGSRWLKINAERWSVNEDEIVCWLTLYAHVRFAPILKDLGQSTDPVYAIIEARTGEKVVEAVQEISACAMPREAAATLKRKRGDPALKVVRRYLDASGSPMLVALSIHPAGSFTHTLRLKREDDAV